VNKITITTMTSIISVVMLSIGIAIVMVPPIVFEVLPSSSPDNEILVEQTMNDPLFTSKLPTLSSTLLILGLVGLGVRGLLLAR
jgi:predicted small integral membrane protein